MIVEVRRWGTVQRMMAHRKIQQITDRTARTAGNPAICGDIGRSVLTIIISCADSFIARDPQVATAGRMGGSACLAGFSGLQHVRGRCSRCFTNFSATFGVCRN
jgi:hypothetical protein